MQKYIAVVNPKMDEDEITQLIRKGIAGAIFEISHQNYPVAMRLIDLVKKLSAKYHKPISLIQDVSGMTDPLDLTIGHRGGVNWVATDKPEHIKVIKGLNKLAGVIYKDRKIPKGLKVDSVMSDNFLDPDASVAGHSHGQIKHLITEHKDQALLDSLIHFVDHSHSSAIAVSDINLAKSLSHRRPKHKIIFAAKDNRLADASAIYWGVHPMYAGDDLLTNIRTNALAKKGDRIMDATQAKHITIHLVP